MKLQLTRVKNALFAPFCKTAEKRSNQTGLRALYRKELADHLHSKRFYLIFALFLITTTASLSGAISSISGSSSDSSEFLFIKLFTTSSSSIYSFGTFIAFLGPLIGITLGFDAVSNERSQGTLNRLASQPIYRDSIINAKFMAGATLILMMVTFLILYVSGTGMLILGIHPCLEEVLRILCYLLLSAVYICVWLALSVLFSVLSRHAATAALVCISVWLFFSLFMNLVATGIANMVYPLEGIAGYGNTLSNYELNLSLNRISPYYLFSEASSTILNPDVRSVGIVTMSQYVGAIAGSLSIGQSLLLVWPHLVVMAAMVIALFAIAYIGFMRQEIRA